MTSVISVCYPRLHQIVSHTHIFTTIRYNSSPVHPPYYLARRTPNAPTPQCIISPTLSRLVAAIVLNTLV